MFRYMMAVLGIVALVAGFAKALGLPSMFDDTSLDAWQIISFGLICSAIAAFVFWLKWLARGESWPDRDYRDPGDQDGGGY